MAFKKFILAGFGAAALGLSLTLAGPASAVTTAPTLPANDKFFAVNCNGNGDPSVWSVLTTGAATPLGTDTSVTCGYGGAYDSLADKYYFIDGSNAPSSISLAEFNPATGDVTQIAVVNGATTNLWQIMIDDASNAYVTGGDDIYSIDLATATTTLIGSIGFSANFGAAAYNPVDQLFYGFGRNTGDILTINPLTGAGTIVQSGVAWTQGTCPDGFNPDSTTGNRPDSAAFDSNGIAWIQMDSGCQSDILAWNPLTNESWSTGVLFDSTQLVFPTAPYDFYSETYIIGRYASSPAPTVDPVLANTGINNNAGLMAGGAALVALLGASLAIASRRRTATK